MTYAKVHEFKTYYELEETLELGNIDNNEPGSEYPRIQQSLDLAAGEINQIISVSYTLPITTDIPFLRWANIVIARKNLSSYDEREKVRADYEDAIARLNAIAKGESALVDSLGQLLTRKETLHADIDIYKGKMFTGNRTATIPKFGF